jgi:hypothetical protein
MTKLNQILDEDEILITFCIIDDVIKAMGMQDETFPYSSSPHGCNPSRTKGRTSSKRSVGTATKL